MNRGKRHCKLLVIGHNLPMRRPGRPVRPFKANPPLIIGPYAVLPFSVALKGFKAIAWQVDEIGKLGGCFQPIQLQARWAVDPGERFDAFSRCEIPGTLVAIADNHADDSSDYALRQA